jgi:hypothetical protein
MADAHFMKLGVREGDKTTDIASLFLDETGI